MDMLDRKYWRAVALAGALLVLAGQLTTSTAAAAAGKPKPATSVRNQPSTPGYLTVIIGRAQLSKAVACKTPANMVTLDQIVPQLAALGVHVTAAVIPARTLPTTSDCTQGSLYPSWADLTSLATHYGLNVVSASANYEYMTTLTTAQQFAQSCGSLPTFIAHGFHRAWGLFAYPDNYYSASVQATVVQNCFAFGRTYINPHTTTGGAATNNELTTATPWLQKTNDVGGGRCSLKGKPCDTEGASSLGNYLSPLTLKALTNVSPGTWTSLQGYTFVTGTSSTGTAKWNCVDPTGNIAVDWTSHWTSAYEVYCWNDFLYAMTGISPSVVVTDPATVAQAWGRVPLPLVTIASVNPPALIPATPSTTITWSAAENGTYAVRVGGIDCSSGTQVAAGTYVTAPLAVATTVAASWFAPGVNAVRICLTNDATHTGFSSATVTTVLGPAVSSVGPTLTPLAGGVSVTVTGTGFTPDAMLTVGGVAATGVTVQSPVAIVATLPAAPGTGAGTYDVVVSEASGTSPVSPADRVTYEAIPGVTGVSPSAGPVTGGSEVTITGTGFSPDATVSFGGLAGTIVGSVSPTMITVFTPATADGNPATDDVVVSDAGGTSPIVPADAFTYTPTVTGVSPSSGPVAGGMSITVSGAGFEADAGVTVGGVAAADVVWVSLTTITATIPESAGDIPGPVDVVVSEAAGVTPASPADLFTYF
jgi:hypothetical protein